MGVVFTCTAIYSGHNTGKRRYRVFNIAARTSPALAGASTGTTERSGNSSTGFRCGGVHSTGNEPDAFWRPSTSLRGEQVLLDYACMQSGNDMSQGFALKPSRCLVGDAGSGVYTMT